MLAVGSSVAALAQASFNQLKPFGFATVSSRTDNTKTFDLKGGGTILPDETATGAVVLVSDGGDMKNKISSVINSSSNKVIILDGSQGDFVISSYKRLG